jgi:putative solute:sodium symporter small subunit
MADKTSSNAYWAANIRVILISMVIWFVCSFGLGHHPASGAFGHHIGGADLGFWFAQNGSIYVFLVLIFVYARKDEQARQRTRRRGVRGGTDGSVYPQPYRHRPVLRAVLRDRVLGPRGLDRGILCRGPGRCPRS